MSDKTPRTIRDVLIVAAKRLQPRRITCAADRDLGRLEAELLLAHALRKERSWLLAHDNASIPALRSAQYRSLVARRLKHEPIAYIIGEKEFFGLPFHIDRRVLIPRPESEMLVELAASRLDSCLRRNDRADKKDAFVWDVGTGSGAIAIAIAKRVPSCNVLATDLSADALAVARANAKRLRATNVKLLKADLLDDSVRATLIKKHHSPLIITANLPYLPIADRKTMERDVTNYEPSSALFAGPDGLALIEPFLRQLAAFDIPFSTLLLEHDPRQTKKIHALVTELFSQPMIRVYKDLAGRNRVTEITKP